jgi:Polyketide cyclase / dehydrase and lipid transport
MIAFQTNVSVNRPIEEVFTFVSDPLLFPLWNSAVQTVELASGQRGRVGSRYSMQRRLPVGQVENQLEVLSRDHASDFVIRTTSGPTPFCYRYRFASDGTDTIIQLDARVELSGVASVLGPLAAAALRRGVDAKLATLKRTLEARASRPKSARP